MSSELRTLSEIEREVQLTTKYKEVDDVLLKSILEEAFSAIEADKEWHKSLDASRDFFDKMLIQQATDTGGQIMFPQLDKITQGFRHPDGTPRAKQGTDPQQLLWTDSLVRELISRSKLNSEWVRHSKDMITDGLCLLGLTIDENGFPFFSFIDPKRVHFEASAEGLHLPDKTVSANWAFWFEEGEVVKLKEKYSDLYPDAIDQINEGTPMSRDDEDMADYQETEEDKDEQDKKKLATILHITCLSSPATAQYGDVKIEKGEPFEMKVVGDARAILSVSTGKDFVWRWANTKKPFMPYVSLAYSSIRKGMRTPSYIQKVRPYIEEIIFLRKIGRRNLKLAGDALQVVNITGDKSETIRNEIVANLRRDLEGEKKTNIIPLASRDLKIEVSSTAPQELNQQAIDNRITLLKQELTEVVQIMVDGTSQHSQEKVGVRRFREEAESGAIGLFQENNFDVFKVIVRMLLSTFITLTPEKSDETVEADQGIKDEDLNEPYKEHFSFSQIKQALEPSCIEFDWNFSKILPTGGLSAVAESEIIEDLSAANSLFPANPEIQNAILSQLGKRIQSVAGTDAFSPQKAMEYVTKQREAMEAQAQQATAQAQMGGQPTSAPKTMSTTQ